MKKPKIQRWIAVLLIICISAALCACGETKKKKVEKTEEKKQEKVTEGPLLYKVTDGNGNVIWLLGSIHVGEEDYYPLPEYIMDAYEGSDKLAVECDIVAVEKDMSAQVSALKQMIYLDGTKISNHISAELYESAKAILEENKLYSEMLDYYYPILWANFVDNVIIEKIGAKAELGIDRFFLKEAKEDGKEILEVESVDFQYGMLAGFSDELQTVQLEAAIESYHDSEKAKEELTELMDAWKKGDEKKLETLVGKETEFASEEERLLYEEYYEAMYTSRNVAMTEFAENRLKAGEETFICVGAAHIVGEGAMVELLRNKGYKVELVRD